MCLKLEYGVENWWYECGAWVSAGGKRVDNVGSYGDSCTMAK